MKKITPFKLKMAKTLSPTLSKSTLLLGLFFNQIVNFTMRLYLKEHIIDFEIFFFLGSYFIA